MTCGTDLDKWSATSALAGVGAESKPLGGEGTATTVGCHGWAADFRDRTPAAFVSGARLPLGVRDRGCLPAEDA